MAPTSPSPLAAEQSLGNPSAESQLGKFAFPLAYLAIAFLFTLLLAMILRENNGTFLYTLDDPYIHLALSDQIRHGHYGLYPGINSAPSSSILFPFLLATVAGTALHPYFPLLLNVFALLLTLEIVRRFLLSLRLGADDFSMLFQAGLLTLMIVCFNILGVVFTGLEHSLQIAMVSATIFGLALFLDRGKMPAWLPVAIVLSPLLRYEGTALSVGALLVLALRGRIRTAAGVFGIIVVALGAFSRFLMHLGLPPMPSSILTKSAVVTGGVSGKLTSMIIGPWHNVISMDLHPLGMVLLAIGAVAALRFLQDLFSKPRVWTNQGLMSLALFCMIAGHAVAGRFGWQERYEDYILFGTALLCIYLTQNTLRALMADPGKHVALASRTAVVFLIIGWRYYQSTEVVPGASNNVYEQQLQMHHFVNDFYHGPVAVNDLGLVSYHNPSFVLDLGGLASEKARLLLAHHASAADYQNFISSNGVHLVIIFDEWFPGQVPSSWQKVGTMSLSRARRSVASSNVQFYATDTPTANVVRRELEQFKSTLPKRVKLVVYPEGSSPAGQPVSTGQNFNPAVTIP